MKRLPTIGLALFAMSGWSSALALDDLVELCGGFEVLTSPDAHEYRGHWKVREGKWPTGLIVAEVTDSGNALVFYAIGQYPKREPQDPNCYIRRGELDGNTLTVGMFNRVTATWKFADDGTATAKWVYRKDDGQRQTTRAELVRER